MARTPGMSYWLDRKYDVQQQQADASTTQAGAAARNAATQAGLAPTAIALDQARTGMISTQTQQLPANDAAARGVQQAQAGLLGAQTTGQSVQSALELNPGSRQQQLAAVLQSLGTNLTLAQQNDLLQAFPDDPDTETLGQTVSRLQGGLGMGAQVDRSGVRVNRGLGMF